MEQKFHRGLYTKQEIIDVITDCSKKMDTFYKNNIFVKRKSKTKKTNPTDKTEYCCEVISEWLLSKLDLFNNIKQLHRDSDYDCSEKSRKSSTEASSGRPEEKIAKELLESSQNGSKEYGILGKFIKHQLPMFDYNQPDCDDSAGKIDLVSYNETENKVYLIELKQITNKIDGLLSAALEIYTYFKQLDKTAFINSFKKNYPTMSKNTNFVPVVLVQKDSRQHHEHNESEFPQLHKLLKKLGIQFFVFDGKNGNYTIESED